METENLRQQDSISIDTFRSILKSLNEISKLSHNTQLSVEDTLKLVIEKIKSTHTLSKNIHIIIHYKNYLFSTNNMGEINSTHELPLMSNQQQVGKLIGGYDPEVQPSETEKIIHDLWINGIRDQLNLYLDNHAAFELLYENAKYFKTLIDAIPSPIYFKDSNEIYLGCNQIYADMILNIEQDSLIGKTVFDFPEFIPDSLANRYHAKDVELLSNGKFQSYNSKLLCTDGKIHEFLIFRQAIKNENNETIGLIGIMTDITSINKLTRQYELLATAVESLNEAVLIINTKGEIGYANPAYHKLIGIYDYEGSDNGIELFLGGDKAKDVFDTMLQTVLSGKIWQDNISRFSKSPTKYDVLATASSIIESDGGILNIVVILRDVSEMKIIEQRLNQGQKLESIGQLAAGIAHEINTPIQYVYNNLSFLRESVEEIHSLLSSINEKFMHDHLPQNEIEILQSHFRETAEEIDLPFLLEEIPLALDGMEKGLQQVSRIVRAMKEFSHPGIAEKILTDINHNISNTITVSRNEWKYSANLVTDFDKSIPHIPCFPGEFNQVILNLIVNASDAIKEKYTDALEIRGLIEIKTEKTQSHIRISIKDNGNGIPTEIQNKVFDPFFTTKQIGKGTGQGLSIAHNVIVNKLKGKIWHETIIGQGTQFFIELPIKENSIP